MINKCKRETKTERGRGRERRKGKKRIRVTVRWSGGRGEREYLEIIFLR